MALNTLNTDAISFKKLSGKVHTQQNFAVTEEGISTNVQSSFSTVFAQPIVKLPVTSSGLTALYATNGIVERVKFQIDLIPDTQIAVGRSQGYRLKLPSDYNTFGELFPEFSAGTYLYTALGKLQIVPALYGTLKLDGTTEYDPILYQTNGSTVIAKFDPINWYLDPYSGILFVQDPPVGYDSSAARPGYLEAFLYVGDYLDDIIFEIGTGNTGTTGVNVGSGVGVFKDKIVTTGGTGVLRFKSFVGIDGVNVTGDSDNIFIGFSGASALTVTVNNGLTKIGNNVRLGGMLTGDTAIEFSGASYFRVTGYDGTLDDVQGDIYVFSDSAKLQSYNNTLGTTNDIWVRTGATTIDYNNGGLSSFLYIGKDVDNAPVYPASSIQLLTTSGISLNHFSMGVSTGITIASGSEVFGDYTHINLNNFDQRIEVKSNTTGFTGVEYYSDYSANYTNRSLVDKEYVDNIVATSGASAGNGLTKIGTTIVLGGTLTGNTFIDGAVQLQIGGTTPLSDYSLYVEGGTGTTEVSIEMNTNVLKLERVESFGDFNDVYVVLRPDRLDVGSVNTNGGSEMRFSPTGITVADVADPNFRGIEYLTDYSPNFTPRSLVDYGYVTGVTVLEYTTQYSSGGLFRLKNQHSTGTPLTGTVTLTNGSATITGLGTQFITDGISSIAVKTSNGYFNLEITPTTETSATIDFVFSPVFTNLGISPTNGTWIFATQTNIQYYDQFDVNYYAELDNQTFNGTIMLSEFENYIHRISEGSVLLGKTFGYNGSSSLSNIYWIGNTIQQNGEGGNTIGVGRTIIFNGEGAKNAFGNDIEINGENGTSIGFSNESLGGNKIFTAGYNVSAGIPTRKYTSVGTVITITGGTFADEYPAGTRLIASVSQFYYDTNTRYTVSTATNNVTANTTTITVTASVAITNGYMHVNRGSQGAVAIGSGNDFNSVGGTNVRPLISRGFGAINISYNDTNQTLDHGNYGHSSVIIGGRNSHIPRGSNYSGIVGGDSIKIGTGVTHTVYMPKVRIGQGTGAGLTTNNTNGNFVVRNSVTGELEIRTAASLTGSSVTSANNGLTLIGQNVRLGGTLTGDTLISGDNGSYVLELGGYTSSNYLSEFAVGVTTYASIHVNNFKGGVEVNDNGISGGSATIYGHGSGSFTGGKVFVGHSYGVRLQGDDPNNGAVRTQLQLTNTFARFTDSRTGSTAVGIEYNANYSANFTPRSLVDKEYVDLAISGVTVVKNIVTGDTTIDNTYGLILCYSTGATLTITLPASPTDNKSFKFKDVTGNANVFNIIVDGNGKNIDGSLTATINSDYGGFEIVYDLFLDEWFVISSVI